MKFPFENKLIFLILIPLISNKITVPITITTNSHYPILFSKNSTNVTIYVPNKKIIYDVISQKKTESHFQCNYDKLISYAENLNTQSYGFVWTKELAIFRGSNYHSFKLFDFTGINALSVLYTYQKDEYYCIVLNEENNIKIYSKNPNQMSYGSYLYTICDDYVEWVLCEKYEDSYFFCVYVCGNKKINGITINVILYKTYYNFEFNEHNDTKGINIFTKFINFYHVIASINVNNDIDIFFYTNKQSPYKPQFKNINNVMKFIEGCSSDIKDFYIDELPEGNELIGCCINNNIIKCSRLNDTNEIIDSFKIETEGYKSFLQIMGVLSNIFIITYESDNNIYAHLMITPLLNSESIEKEFLINGENNINFEELFTQYIDTKYYVKLTQLTSSSFGKLYYENEIIEIDKKYLISSDKEFKYKSFSNIGTEELKYKIYNEETYSTSEGSIIINIIPCYKSCSSCIKKEDSISHNCLSCSNNHYLSPEEPNSCFLESEKQSNWYLDENENKFKICDESCTECSEGKNSTNTNCINKKCSNNYAYLEDDETNCILKTLELLYYLLEGNIFKRCKETCKKCYSNLNYCSSCIEGTIKEAGTGNCRYPSEVNNGYYIKDSYMFKCYERCKTCNDGYDDINNVHNCIICNNDYYLVNGSSNCLTLSEGENQDLFLKKVINDNNEEVYYFFSCYNKCNGCNDIYDEENNIMNCKNCISDYYFLNDTTNCYDLSIINNGYYFQDNKFYKCYPSCKKCSNEGNVNNHNCDVCQDNFAFVNNSKNCFDKNINYEGYYLKDDKFYKCYSSCKTCSNEGNLNNHNCDECIDNYYFLFSTYNCFDNNYINEGYYLSNNIFYPCDSNCKTCSSNQDLNSQNCLTCKTSNYLIENINNCSTIIDGYYLDSNILKKCHFSCKRCYGAPIENENIKLEDLNCEICIDNYYKIKDTNNCHDSSMTNSGYFLRDDYWDLCNEFCKECTYNNDNIECIKCMDNYYFKKGTKNCYNDETIGAGYFLNTITKLYEKCNEACESCYGKENLDCIKCNIGEGYYNVEGISESNCFNESTLPSNNYYLSNNKYYLCYEKCETCATSGIESYQNCFSCKNKSLILYKSNCIEKCPKVLYKYNYECYKECPEGKYTYEYIKECVDECPKDTKILNNNCIINSIHSNDTDSIIDKIDDNIRLYTSSDSLIKGDDITIQVYEIHDTDIINIIAHEAKLSTIELNECYQFLKNYYHIPQNEDIIMLKVDKSIENSPVNQVFFYLYDFKGNKLDSSLCENINIEKPLINIDNLNLNLAEELYQKGIDIYKANNSFFNNLCNPFSSENGTDVTLKDRRADYYQNISFCEIDCTYDHIDYDNMKVICNCDPEENIESINNAKPLSFNNMKNAFTSNLFTWNFFVIKCYNLVFNWNIMKKNYGCWIMIGVFILTILSTLYYFRKGIRPIRNFLILFEPENNKIKYNMNDNNKDTEYDVNTSDELNKSNPPKKSGLFQSSIVFTIDDSLDDNEDNKNNEVQENFNTELNEIINEDNEEKIDYNLTKKISCSNYEYDIGNGDIKIKKSLSNDFSKSKINSKTLNNNYSDCESHCDSFNSYKKKRSKFVSNNKENILTLYNHHHRQSSISSTKYSTTSLNKETAFHKYKDKEFRKSNFEKKEKNEKKTNYNNDFNDMKYDEAINKDLRSIIKIYWDYLQINQIIISTFIVESFLELRIIKIVLILFSIGLEFTLNAFFYTDDYISKAYSRNGVVDFISDLPKSVYSLIVSFFLSFCLGILSNSKSNLEKVLQKENNTEKYKELCKKILKNLKIKLFFFFTIVFLFELLFWYYCSAFCAVYQNSQKLWMLGTIESFIITLILPFGLCFIIAIFRYLSLKFKLKILFYICRFLDLFM